MRDESRWWLDRERLNGLSGYCVCVGAGRGKEKGGRPTTARGGGFEWFSCSGTVAEIGRSCSFFLAICVYRGYKRITSSFRLFRLVSSRFVLFCPVSAFCVSSSLYQLLSLSLASDQALGSSTSRTVATFRFSYEPNTEFRTPATILRFIYLLSRNINYKKVDLNVS